MCIRDSYGDVYKGSEMKIPGAGKVELVYTAEDGSETRELVHNFDGAGIVQGMHNICLLYTSRLESLKNITERYDGYGNSIRKVMECKKTEPGLIGVVADIIKVEQKYEAAIETALGGSIQNIVTDTENTAKKTVSYTHLEDISIMAGVNPSEESYFGTTVVEHVKSRLPWLLFLILSTTVTQMIMNSYEAALAVMPQLAGFIPMLTGTGGRCV